MSAWPSRTAFSRIASKTGSRRPGDEEIAPRISAVAVCCSNASLSSRRSRTTSVSWPEADELLWHTAFGAFALRLRALASLLPALERRRIAHPKGSGLRRLLGLQQGLRYCCKVNGLVWTAGVKAPFVRK